MNLITRGGLALAAILVAGLVAGSNSVTAKVGGLDVLSTPVIVEKEPRSDGLDPDGLDPVADTCDLPLPWVRPKPEKPWGIPFPPTILGGPGPGCQGLDVTEVSSGNGIVNIALDISSWFCAFDRAFGRLAAHHYGVIYDGGAYCGLMAP